jgi:hypothetical protein
MNAITKTLAAAAVTAAGLSLAACGSQHASTTAAHPQTCVQQYRAWEATPATQQFRADARRIVQAGKTEDVPRMLSAMRQVGPASRALGQMPRCADPAGYSRQVQGYVQAAADNAGAGTGMAAVELAAAPMGKADAASGKMTRELDQTVPGR